MADAPTPASPPAAGDHPKTLGDALNNIAMHVPGFAGYKSAEDRRIADKQLRAVIGERLTTLKGRLDGVVDAQTRAGRLDGLAQIDATGRRLERLIDRMRFADYGYSAIFDRVQLNDADLLRIYQYDAAIMADLGVFEDAIGGVESSAGDAGALAAALAKLDALTAEFDRRVEARKHLFDGLPTP